MKKKVIFLDLDGTMLDANGRIPSSARTAMSQARKNGHQLVICSGRGVMQIPQELKDSPLFSGIVCATGAYVQVGGNIILCACIRPDQLRKIVHFLEDSGAYYFLQCVSGNYGTARSAKYGEEMIGPRKSDPIKKGAFYGVPVELSRLETMTDCNKLIYFECRKTDEEILRSAGSYFQVTGSSMLIDENASLRNGEITDARYTKSTGMDCYLRAVGISREDSVAFGDGPNDIDMICHAGTGVAMGNAIGLLKKEADIITTDINDNGIFNGFRKLGLI
jgi:Cof subfamily protein (haloacid dehalogenase superfamily)